MTQINDSVTAVEGPTFNESMFAFFKATGAAGDTLQDAEMNCLLPRTGGLVGGGTTQDRWYRMLRQEGYTGSLDDMKAAWWAAQTP